MDKEFSDKNEDVVTSPHDTDDDNDDDDDGDVQGEADGGYYISQAALDQALEEKSRENNLTATNVRSIIYQVITNKDVQTMFRKQLKKGNLEEQLREAIFEPKMTRSKLKEVLKSGQVPASWNVTPRPKNKTLLDLNFEEEDEDEDAEYAPSMEELEHVSDDDESISSSRVSECGSPFLTISSPEIKRFPVEISHLAGGSTTPKSKDTQDGKVVMGPPRNTLPIKKLILQTEESQKSSIVALRTRSKLPLRNTSITELESMNRDPELPDRSSPVATNHDNEDWQLFLAGLVDENLGRNVYAEDEDTNDPEYNFMAEEEKQDKEEVRFDKGVQIPKKEVKSLLDELMDEFNSEEIEDLPFLPFLNEDGVQNLNEDETTPPTQPQEADVASESPQNEYPMHIPKLNVGTEMLAILGLWDVGGNQDVPAAKDGAAEMITLSEEEQIQLKVQMAQHVQLLAQTYICSSHLPSSPELLHLSNTSKHLLLELQGFSGNSANSFFSTPNLNHAIEITKKSTYEDDNNTTILGSNALDLNFRQMDAIANSCAFLYPAMLPKSKFTSGDETKSKMFLKSEDGLLAIGLNQFGHLPNELKFIKELLLPTKTEEQIKGRIRNLKRNRSGTKHDNPLRQLFINNKLPRFERNLDILGPKDVIPPIRRESSVLPNWFHNYNKIAGPSLLSDTNPKPKATTKRNVSTILDLNSQASQDIPQNVPLIFVQVQPMNAGVYLPYGVPPVLISNVPHAQCTPTITSSSRPKTGCSTSNKPITSGKSVVRVSNRKVMKAHLPIVPVIKVFTPASLPVTEVPSTTVAVAPPPSASPRLQNQNGVPSSSDIVGTPSESSENSNAPTISVTETVESQACTGTGLLQLNPPINDRPVVSPVILPTLVTFAGSVPPDRDLPPSENPPAIPRAKENPEVAREKDLLVTTSSGMTLTVKSLDNSREPCVVLSHEQLRALGIKINQVSEESKCLQPAANSNEKIDPVMQSNCPRTLKSNPSDNETSLVNKKHIHSGASNEFLKNFGTSVPVDANNANNASSNGNNGNLKCLQSLNKTLSLQISGDISLNSTDAIGLHNLEDFISSRELSKAIGRTIDSEDSLYKLTDSQLVDLLGFSPFKGMLDSTLPNTESNNSLSVSLANPVDSCIKNLFNEISPQDKNKRVSVSSALEYFSSENFVSSTPLAKDASSKNDLQRSDILKFAINDLSHINNNSDSLLKGFNEACVEDKNDDAEVSGAADIADVPPIQEIVDDINPREQPQKSCEELNSVDNLRVVVFADVENADSQPEAELLHHEVEATEQNAVLCTPKKFSVNEYDNIKKLTSPTLSIGTTTPSCKDDMSPNSKKCTLGTIAQLEKLISPPKSPIGARVRVEHVLRAGSPVEFGQKTPQLTGKNGIMASPFKKRFTNFRPKHLNFCSLDGACDNKDVQRSSNGRQLRSVAPKPPFIKITGEPQKSKKPLGRRKRNAPPEKHVVDIRPKDPEPEEVAGDPTPITLGMESSTNRGTCFFTEDEGGIDEDVLIAELMSASTTIDFNKKATAQLLEKQKALRQKEKQDLMMSLLDEKLLESDPMRKRRDMLYAESYVSRVKERFKDRPDLFSEFNQLLFRFANAFSKELNEKEAMEEHGKLYGTLKELFKNHEDLLADYAGFLPLDQAVALGCFISSLEFEKARIFLTKLERYFKKRPQTFHRCLKAFKECREGLLSEEDMRNFISKQIRNNSHLITEFSWFFPDNRPQLSQKNISFEEVDLCLETKSTSKEFEKVELSLENVENLGTPSCTCACHINLSEQLVKKSRHCPACSPKAQLGSRQAANSVNSQVSKGKCHLQNEERSSPRNSYSSHGYQKSATDACNDAITDDKTLPVFGSQPSITSKTISSKSKSKSPPGRSRFPRPVRKGKSTLDSCQNASENQNNPKENVICGNAGAQLKKVKQNCAESRDPVDQNADKSCESKGQKNSKNSRKKNSTDATVKPHPRRSARTETTTTCNSGDRNYDLGPVNQRPKRKRCIISSSESDLEVEGLKPEKKLRKRGDGDGRLETININELSEKTGVDQEGEEIVSPNEPEQVHRGCSVQSSVAECTPTICEVWSRDEDKVLLEMCKLSGSDLPTFESVAGLLGNKSSEQVNHRFEHLMEIYSKMDSDSETEESPA